MKIIFILSFMIIVSYFIVMCISLKIVIPAFSCKKGLSVLEEKVKRYTSDSHQCTGLWYLQRCTLAPLNWCKFTWDKCMKKWLGMNLRKCTNWLGMNQAKKYILTPDEFRDNYELTLDKSQENYKEKYKMKCNPRKSINWSIRELIGYESVCSMNQWKVWIKLWQIRAKSTNWLEMKLGKKIQIIWESHLI